MKPIIMSTEDVRALLDGKACLYCGKTFYRNNRHNANWKRAKYCSRDCVTKSQSHDIDENIVIKMHEEGKTIVEISSELGCSATPVRKALTKHGLSRTAAPRVGIFNGDKNPAWQGGRRVRTDGYVVVWTPEGEMLEHQYVVEKHIGRKLFPSEVIHHIDRNKQNNDINNLQIMGRSDHAKVHANEMQEGRHSA